MSKRILAIFLSAIILMLPCAVGASALTAEDTDLSEYPIILIPGYSGTELVEVKADGTRVSVWHPDYNKILERVLARIAELGAGLGLAIGGDATYIGDVVGGELEDMMGVLSCNPDGTSINNIQIANPSIAETNMASIHENGFPEMYVGEPDLFSEISAIVGEEKCYFFTEDWRMNATDCAARLDSYIQEVKEHSGKDKVNLLAVSHGGEITATYLSLYGYKMDVDNAVMTVPAMGGAALAYDIMSDNVKLDEHLLVYYIEHGMIAKNDYEWLVEAQQFGILDEIIHAIVPHAKNVIGNFGSIWDFIPEEYYEELKASELDPVLNARLIEKSDYQHNVIMPNYHEALSKCITDYGMNVTVIAGTGSPSVTGLQENADAIIAVNDSTGATTAHFGERYNDGYTGIMTTCDDPSHNHISPSMEVDGTTAFLPENTWYVEELFHGMTFNDDYSRQLAITALLTDRITDVYSDPAYPQFHASTNRCNTVFAAFNNSAEGFVSSADTSLIIKNIDKEYPIKLLSVNIAGADVTAKALGVSEIQPDESVEIPITGTLPEVSHQLMQVTVTYYTEGNMLTPTGSRTFNFTIMNGDPVPYDMTNPTVSADYSTSFEQLIGTAKTDKFSEFGILEFLNRLYEIVYGIFKELGIYSLITK